MLPCLHRLAAFLFVLIFVPASAWAAQSPASNTNHDGAQEVVKSQVPGPAVVPQVLGTVRVYGLLSPDAYLVGGTHSATHTDTPLIDIPQTLQAISSGLLRDQAAQSMGDAMRNAPGVSVHQGEGNRDEIVIRGVKTKSAFFINGVPDDTEHFRDMYNVQEIDVLQGPSAVLFGRGGAGGVVNVVTKKPTNKRFLHLGMQVGSWDHRRLTLDTNVPFAQDGGFRLNVMGEDSGGYRQYYYLHRYGVDPEVRFDLGPDTILELGAQRLYDNRRADRGIPSRDGRPVDVGRATFFGSPTQNIARSSISAFHARVAHYTGNLTFRDTFRGARTNKFYRNMFPGSEVAADDTLTLSGYEHGHDRTSFFNQAEMEWDTHTGALEHTVLVGLELSHGADDDWENKAHKITDVLLSDPTAAGVFDVPDRNNTVTGRNTALYAEDQLTIGHWKALLGLRYTRFTVDGRFHLSGNATIHHVDTAWTPRVGLIYQPTKQQSIYASVTRTFTPQGSNLALSIKHPKGADLSPQTAVNYEVGYKAQWLDNRVTFSSDVFQLKQKHVNSRDPNDPTQLVQTGAQRVRGFETSLGGKLTSHWSIHAGYARLNARILDATTKAPAGARVPLVPRHQFSLWTRYRFNRHWGVGGGLAGNSREFTGFDNTVILPGYVRADLMAYYQADGYRVGLNFKNLFDIHYYPTANGNNQIMPGAPRNVQLSLRVDL